MKYEVVNGKLVISGSLYEYGVRARAQSIVSSIFPIEVDILAREARLAEDEKIRNYFNKRGMLPKTLRDKI